MIGSKLIFLNFGSWCVQRTGKLFRFTLIVVDFMLIFGKFGQSIDKSFPFDFWFGTSPLIIIKETTKQSMQIVWARMRNDTPFVLLSTLNETKFQSYDCGLMVRSTIGIILFFSFRSLEWFCRGGSTAAVAYFSIEVLHYSSTII